MKITRKLKRISLCYRDLKTVSIISRAEKLLERYPNKEVYILKALKKILEKTTNNFERRMLINILNEKINKIS